MVSTTVLPGGGLERYRFIVSVVIASYEPCFAWYFKLGDCGIGYEAVFF